MQILSHWILRLLHPKVAASPAPMRRLFSTSRPLPSPMASAPLRWWRLPRMAAPDPPVRRLSRFPHGSVVSGSGVRGAEECAKPDSRPLIPSIKDVMISLGEHSQSMKNVENCDATKDFISLYGYGHPANAEQDGRKASMGVIFCDKEAPRTTVEITDGKRETWGKWGDVLVDSDRRATKGCKGEITVGDDEESVSQEAEIPRCSVDRVTPLEILRDSSHRDGSIYRDTFYLKEFRIVDRSETRLEAMMLSDPSDCIMRNGTCMLHLPQRMLQIFSLKLAKIPVDAGSVELYGYLAVRDGLEPLLNYFVNVSRDDPITVEEFTRRRRCGTDAGHGGTRAVRQEAHGAWVGCSEQVGRLLGYSAETTQGTSHGGGDAARMQATETRQQSSMMPTGPVGLGCIEQVGRLLGYSAETTQIIVTEGRKNQNHAQKEEGDHSQYTREIMTSKRS